MVSTIEIYAALLIQFQDPNHPAVLLFYNRNSSNKEFVLQAKQLIAIFTIKNSGFNTFLATLNGSVIAFYGLLRQIRAGPNTSLDPPMKGGGEG